MKTSLRKRKREATRTSIIEESMRLFVESGYENVTIDDIAEACEVSARTFFRYFGTKEDVLFAGSDERCALLLEAIDAQPPDAGPFEALEGASRTIAAHYAAERDLLCARARIIDTAPSLQRRNAELPQRWDHDVVKLLRSSGRADGVDDLELRVVVGASMTALRVAIEVWIASDGAELESLIDAAFAGLADGFGPRRRGSRRAR